MTRGVPRTAYPSRPGSILPDLTHTLISPRHVPRVINKLEIINSSLHARKKVHQVPPGQGAGSSDARMRHMQEVRFGLKMGKSCDSDNLPRRKLRCSGTLPCSLCFRSGIECQYNAGYKRGKVPSIPIMDQEETLGLQSPQKSTEAKSENYQLSPMETLILSTEQQTQATPIAPSNVQDSDCFSKDTTLSGTPVPITPLQERVVINDRAQASSGTLLNGQQAITSQIHQEADEIDLEGHYVGPSSGVAFLLRVQKRLHENLRFSPSELIFNFGDAPFPNCDPQFLVLPPIDEALVLVNRYFEFSFPTHRFLHQATVEQWVHLFYSGIQGVNDNVSRAIKALILMVIAQGKQNSSGMETTAGQSVNR